jgi:hypothetical protein
LIFSPLRVCNEIDVLIQGISFLLFKLALVDWMDDGMFLLGGVLGALFGRDRQIDGIDLECDE